MHCDLRTLILGYIPGQQLSDITPDCLFLPFLDCINSTHHNPLNHPLLFLSRLFPPFPLPSSPSLSQSQSIATFRIASNSVFLTFALNSSSSASSTILSWFVGACASNALNLHSRHSSGRTVRVSDNLQLGVKGWAQDPDWTVQTCVQEKVQAVNQHILLFFR